KSFSSIKRNSISAGPVDGARLSARLGTARAYSAMTRDIASLRSTVPPPITRALIGRSNRRMPSGRAPMRRSEPKASARKPRSSSATLKRVYCGGAPSKEPGGADCLPDAPSAAVVIESRTGAASNRFIVASGLLSLPHQAFLGNRGNKRSVAFKYKSARIAARAMQTRRILRVKQPIIGAERPVKPQRMIQAGSHELLFEQRASVRGERRVEQHHIGGVGQYALMNRREVGQFSGGANPDVELSAGNLLAEITLEFHRSQLDRALALVITPDRIRHHRQ